MPWDRNYCVNTNAQAGFFPPPYPSNMTSVPERSEIPENLNMQAIVELYSR